MILSLREIIDILIMTGFLGYLFMDMIRPRRDVSVLSMVDKGLDLRGMKKSMWWKDFKYAAAVLGPAIILHELAHKFVAIGFGLDAQFYAFYASQTTLILGLIAVLAKLMGWGFFLIVPGFVRIFGGATPFESTLIAFAGPAIHALFYLGCILLTRYVTLTPRQRDFVAVTQKVNGFLFIFNMLPIPGFDGSKILSGLLGML